MRANLFILLCLLGGLPLSATSSDTAFVRMEKFRRYSTYSHPPAFVVKNDTFVVASNTNPEIPNTTKRMAELSINGAYYVFVNASGKKIEEGYWSPEHWNKGGYKRYWKNGNIRSEGSYNDNNARTGTWKFYSRSGKLKKTKQYP